ncbi:MAG: 50S ribosomal protein L18 [Thermodesulfobacteriota bacterium]
MAKTNPKKIARQNRIKRIRKKISGSSFRPRFHVFKSSKHIYAQIIDDDTGKTLAACSTLNESIKKEEDKGKTAKAFKVGELIASMSKSRGIDKVIFDRGGYPYHGRVKELSRGAREGGLEF